MSNKMLQRRSNATTQRAVTELAGRGGEADPNGRQLRVPLTAIRANPRQPRKTIDEDGIGQLAASMRKVGLLNPISIRHIGDQTYELIAGQRRLLAAQRNGDETILARVFQANAPAAALIENVQREDLNLYELAHAIRDLMESEGIKDRSAAADMLGMERTRVSRILGVLNLPEDVLEDFRTDPSLVSASRMFEVASAGSEDRQRKLWQLARLGLGERELRAAKRDEAAIIPPDAGAEDVEPAKPRLARPLKPGRALLEVIDRLTLTVDSLPSGKTMDDDHRQRLANLQDRIARLLKR